jgi:hypothetical protein
MRNLCRGYFLSISYQLRVVDTALYGPESWPGESDILEQPFG